MREVRRKERRKRIKAGERLEEGKRKEERKRMKQGER